MPYEVSDSSYELKPEAKWFTGDLVSAVEEEGQFGTQVKWSIELDVDKDDPYIDDTGAEQVRETWMWCSAKITTHEKNKFRKIVKGLTGAEPQKGEMFDENHWTRTFYEDNPGEDPKKLTGKDAPWRVAVMFEHKMKADKSMTESITMMVHESAI